MASQKINRLIAALGMCIRSTASGSSVLLWAYIHFSASSTKRLVKSLQELKVPASDTSQQHGFLKNLGQLVMSPTVCQNLCSRSASEHNKLTGLPLKFTSVSFGKVGIAFACHLSSILSHDTSETEAGGLDTNFSSSLWGLGDIQWQHVACLSLPAGPPFLFNKACLFSGMKTKTLGIE